MFGRRKPENTERTAQGENRLRALDRSQYDRFRLAPGQAASIQSDVKGLQQCEQESDHRNEHAITLVKFQHLGLQSHVVEIKLPRRDDGTTTLAPPTVRGRAGYAIARDDAGIPADSDNLLETVIVGLVISLYGVRHNRIIAALLAIRNLGCLRQR